MTDGKTILLADDNEEARHLFETFLVSKGYNCIVASNGKEALEKLRSHRVDIILSDVIMPVVDGFELLRRVKNEESGKGIPFILYSGVYTGEEDEQFAKKIGADRFFGKPYDFNKMLSAIEEEIKKSEKGGGTTRKSLEETDILRAYGERLTSKLKKEAERWRTVFDSMLDMVALLEESGLILLWNRAFEEYFGPNLKKESHKCAHVLECADWKTKDCPLLNARKGKKRESREIHRNGSFFIEIIEPIIEPDGSVRRFVQIVRDITQEKKAEYALKQSEKKYHSIFEYAINGIYQMTLNGEFLLANPSFINMLSYESFQELKDCLKDIKRDLFLKPEDFEYIKQSLLQGGIVRGFETELKRKDGAIIWVTIDAHLVKDTYGENTFIQGFAEEITEKKKVELELREMAEKLKRSFFATVRALSTVIDLRDPYTAGHQRRVSNLAAMIAQEMKMSNDFVENVRIAGEIHDIGKVAVPSEILTRPGKLLREEMDIIKRHPEIGYEILRDAEMPDPIPRIVYEHHERMNGSGYPRGLKGNQITMGARILAVADVVEVISTHRPYRPAIGLDAACEEINKGKGEFYDGEVVEACLRILKNAGNLPF
ncbi:MAG: PAS domain S-box protein [Deltaproteobacteria bacterium]|nr:PAS domain S-box protein [Deltaproteobacteria bacterium]